MGVKVEVIIEHKLSPQHLLLIVKEFRNIKLQSNDDSQADWQWTRKNISCEFLVDYWNRPVNWYLQNEWSEEDLALIYGPNSFIIDFYKPILLL